MTDHTIIAIHQPNFFPWLGYFAKIVRADLFLLLDNVQMQKTGGTWVNRVQLLVNGRAAWVTLPIVRAYTGLRTIREMQINDTTPWRSKLLKTLQTNYARAPCYHETMSVLTDVITTPTDSLAEYNITIIYKLTEALRLDMHKLILGSTLNTNGKATDLLVGMVKAVNGTTYLCGGGASDYQDDEKFADAGLKLIYQHFQHPIYPQVNTQAFIPGLSIIDALMNCGFGGVSRLLTSDQRQTP